MIVTVQHGTITLRCKGLRSREVVDIGAVYERAVRERVMYERSQRSQRRKNGGRK